MHRVKMKHHQFTFQHSLVSPVHLQPDHRADIASAVQVLIAIPLGVPSVSLPGWIISQVQLLHILRKHKTIFTSPSPALSFHSSVSTEVSYINKTNSSMESRYHHMWGN